MDKTDRILTAEEVAQILKARPDLLQKMGKILALPEAERKKAIDRELQETEEAKRKEKGR